MTIDQFIQELKWLCQDPTIEAALPRLIKDERLAFAAEFELPALKLKEPALIEVDDGNWLYDLPEDYHKHVFLWREGTTTPRVSSHIIRSLTALDRLDPEHTKTGARVDYLAVEDRQFGVYPQANTEIGLWYYRTPDVEGDIAEIPDEWVYKALVPRIVLRCFRLYPELARDESSFDVRALDLWRVRAREGIYGSAQTGEIGFMHFLSKSRPPRVRGASPGRRLP